LALAVPAQAQATRTWVSGVGDDANPCSRTAPCKTFAGAISKTAANGIINCIDPGGFGAVTITKSITIDCKNTQAGILAAACLYALEHNVARLAEDHANAERLARGLAQITALKVSQATNMVFVELAPQHRAPLAAHLSEHGIILRATPVCRLVTHLDVSAADIDKTVAAVKDYFSKSR